MKRNTAKLYILAGAVCLSAALVLGWLSFRNLSLLWGVPIFAFPALSAIHSGYSGYKNSNREDDPDCDRDGLMARSLIRGFVQIKLFGNKTGLIQLAIFLLGLSTLGLGTHDASAIYGSSNAFTDAMTGMFLFSFGATAVLFSVLWSMLEVNDYCNKKGMSHKGGVFEMELENTKLGLTVLFIVTSIVLIGLSAIFIYSWHI